MGGIFGFFVLFVCFLLIKGLEFSIFIYACMYVSV